MFTIVTFGATPAMPMPFSAAPTLPATCVPWPSSSSFAGSTQLGVLARAVDRRDVGHEVPRQRRVEVRRDVRMRPVDAGVEDPDQNAFVPGLLARTSPRASHGSSPCPTEGWRAALPRRSSCRPSSALPACRAWPAWPASASPASSSPARARPPTAPRRRASRAGVEPERRPARSSQRPRAPPSTRRSGGSPPSSTRPWRRRCPCSPARSGRPPPRPPAVRLRATRSGRRARRTRNLCRPAAARGRRRQHHERQHADQRKPVTLRQSPLLSVPPERPLPLLAAHESRRTRRELTGIWSEASARGLVRSHGPGPGPRTAALHPRGKESRSR